MQDKKGKRVQVFGQVLTLCESQLRACAEQMEAINSIMSSARSPRERTSINIVRDDQRKVIKALKRLHDDISEIRSNDI
jgi:hypothetical protein